MVSTLFGCLHVLHISIIKELRFVMLYQLSLYYDNSSEYDHKNEALGFSTTVVVGLYDIHIRM